MRPAGAGVGRLGEHPLDPGPHPGLGRVDPLHPALEGGEEPASAVVEQEEEQLVLRLEVPVEGLGGEAGLGQDLPQRRVDVAGALDEVVGGLEHPLDLVGVLACGGRPSERSTARWAKVPRGLRPQRRSRAVQSSDLLPSEQYSVGRRPAGNMERELVLTGIGGQGVQLAAQVLARAAIAEGREVQMFGSYGGMMRGGNTEATVVIADGAIEAPPTVGRRPGRRSSCTTTTPSRRRAKLRPGSLVLVNTTVFEGAFDATSTAWSRCRPPTSRSSSATS